MIVFALKVSVTTKTNGWPVLSKKELGKTFPYFVGPLFHKSFEEYDYNLDFEAQSIILPRATSSTLIMKQEVKHQMINLILQACCSYTLNVQLLLGWRQKQLIYTQIIHTHLDVALDPNHPWFPPYPTPHYKSSPPLISWNSLLLNLLSFLPQFVYMPRL